MYVYIGFILKIWLQWKKGMFRLLSVEIWQYKSIKITLITLKKMYKRQKEGKERIRVESYPHQWWILIVAISITVDPIDLWITCSILICERVGEAWETQISVG